MNTSSSLRLRSVLASYGSHDLWRTNDRDLAIRFRTLLRSGIRLRSLLDVESAITFRSGEPARAPEYTPLFETAVDLLSFWTPKNTGILYSGQYGIFPEYGMRGGTAGGDSDVGSLVGKFSQSTIKMKTVAQTRAAGGGKYTISQTEGGRWLLRYNLAVLVGTKIEDVIWSRASAKFVRSLEGEVEVYLSFPEFQRVFRSVEGHVLFENPKVSRILYFLEHGKSRLADMPPELFAQGIVRRARGKELVFRVAATN